MVTQGCPIWWPKEEREEKQKKKAKGKGKGLRYRDQTISSHYLPHTEVRDGRATLDGAEKELDGFKGRLGFSSKGSSEKSTLPTH